MISVSASHAPLLVALAKGYFAEAGLDVRYTELRDALAATTALGTGQLDVAVTVPSVAFFNAVAGGVRVKIVSSMGAIPQHGDPVALVVRRDLVDSGRVRAVTDIRGRRLALAGGRTSSQAYQAGLVLAAAGLTLKDVDVVSLAFPETVTALKNGAVDASLLPAPFLGQAVENGWASIIAGSAGRGRSSVATFFGDSFAHERPAVARAVLTALVRGARDLQGGGVRSEDNLEAIAKYTGLSVDALHGMDPYMYDPDLMPDTNTVLDMQRAFFSDAQLAYTTLLTADQLIDPSFSSAAVATLGRYVP